MNPLEHVHETPPSALRYMLQAFRPSSGWQAAQGFPALRMTWRDFRIDAATLAEVAGIAGASPESDALRLLCPHIIGFRQLMAMLTHPAWPLPVWGALQVRNRLALHRRYVGDEGFALVTGVSGWRMLEKGLEVDLHSRLLQDERCAWESVITFYYRGRFGATAQQGDERGTPAAAPAHDERFAQAARWRTATDARWRFGALTGDYNGIHQWDAWARRFGFPAAFAHPQRVVAQCLARLQAPPAVPQQLDLWLKGPVFYGHEVTLREAPLPQHDGREFALFGTGDPRPAILGRWLAMPAGR